MMDEKPLYINKLERIALTAALILVTISLGHSSNIPQHLDANGSYLIGNSENITSAVNNCINCSGFQSNANVLKSLHDGCSLSGGLPGPNGAWTWQNPLPQGNALVALDVVGDSIWTAGYTEAVYRSADRGATWKATDVDVTQTIADLVFANESTGWITANFANGDQGQGGICSTDDGGATWSNPVHFNTEVISCLYFDHDNVRLWAGGSSGFVAYSDDYGKNFTDASIPMGQDYNAQIIQLVFLNKSTGFALTMNRLYYTTNAGQNWEVAHDWGSGTILYAMAAQPGTMTQSNMICVVGQSGFAQMSEDGANWFDINIDTTANLDTVAIHGSQAFIAGTDGTAFRTEIVHSNIWEPAAIPISVKLFKAIYRGIDDIFVSGDCGMLMLSEDGGVTWKRIGSGSILGLTDVAFRDAENGWAVGNNGCVLHTKDGKTWEKQRSDTNKDLNSVSFVSYLKGWAVGEKGCIIATTDGGKKWKKQRSSASHDLLGVSFADQDNGWAVGSGGLILHTANGGGSWQSQTSPVKNNLRAVSFVDDKNGWAVGDYGSVLRTTNGGRTWNEINLSAGDFKDVHFTDSKYGWICGTTRFLLDGNIAYRTVDGGVTWIRETIPIDASFKVDFVDRNHGWQIGMFGHVIATDDGGLTWRVMPDSSPACWLRSIDMIDQKTGYVAGECGAILRTDTGGDVPQ